MLNQADGPWRQYPPTLTTWRLKVQNSGWRKPSRRCLLNSASCHDKPLPFNHCGCRYSKIADGIKVDQADYVSMLQLIPISKGDPEERDLLPAEITLLRSADWRAHVDRTHEARIYLQNFLPLQSVMNKAKVKHLKDANELVLRAQRDKEAAILYRNLECSSYRIVCIHDASAASSTKNYAQEGVIVVLMADYLDVEDNHVIASDEFARTRLSGRAQLLHMQSNKAKRVSYSTSHGETLAAINGLECATLVSTRLAEITYGGKAPTIPAAIGCTRKRMCLFSRGHAYGCKGLLGVEHRCQGSSSGQVSAVIHTGSPRGTLIRAHSLGYFDTY